MPLEQGKEVTETGSPELQDKPAHQNHVVLRENHNTGPRTAQSMPFVTPNLSGSLDIPRCHTDSVVHRKAQDRSMLTHDPRLIQNTSLEVCKHFILDWAERLRTISQKRVDLITDALQEAEGGCGHTEPQDSRAAAGEMYANQSLEECRDIIITWARELRNQYEPASEREETDENKNVDQENAEDFSRQSPEKTDQGKEWNLERCEVILKEWASELRSVTEICGLAQAESCGLDQLAVEKWTGELLCTVCPVIEFIMRALLEKSL
ncbi:uncharacterized protein LOC117968155 [Acipenser ruthenus]|uniref:uncharacterized protein LOC117968155 n=1 Tax=Acipenser ruthenus TaxID=7906 RepID=UPI002741CAB8|nr:uncharacterized protein LOC117968155 [Acipenser ruthenus]XP_058875447.1 uncharacterized protein LOC117968155 [Acipenser ruthenus]